MDIMEILDVVAGSVESFFTAISYLDALLIVATFIGSVFLVLWAHVLFGVKASTAHRVRSIARYFEGHYIGSYLDAKRFLRRKRFLLTRRARREFDMFLHSTTKLTDTDFADVVSSRGRYSLHFVLDTFGIAMLVGVAFTLLKSWISGLNGLKMAIFTVVPLVIMFILRLVLFASIRLVNKCYHKAVKRLVKSEEYVRFNNEGYTLRDEDSHKSPVISGLTSSFGSLSRDESVIDGDTAVNIVDNAAIIKSSLSSEDAASFDEFLTRLDSARSI